jgi:outer membrane cobalamin receptor
MQPNLRLNMGVRYDRYQLIGGRKEDLLSPRLGINWESARGPILRATAGSGFRAATIIERFLELSIMNFNIVSNEALKAERSWAFDFGFKQHINKNWQVDVSIFNNEYYELIEAHLNLIRGQIQFRNIPRARVRGIEASMNWTQQFKVFRPALDVSLTAMDHENITWQEPLPYRPNLIGFVKAGLEYKSILLEGDYQYASRIDEVKIYPINERVALHQVNVRLSGSFNHYAYILGVENLFQYNYAPMESN